MRADSRPVCNSHAEQSAIHGNISRSAAFGELRVTETFYPSQLRLSQHTHEFGAFGFVIDGEWYEDYRKNSLLVSKGSVYFRPPQLPHSNAVAQNGVRCLYVEMSPHWLAHVPGFAPFLNDPQVLRQGYIGFLADRIYTEWQLHDDVSTLAIEGLTCELAAQICRGMRADKEDQRPPYWLQTVHELVHSRFANLPSLTEIAHEVGVHPVQVSRQFRRFYGLTIGESVRRTRIEFACQQLLNPDVPMVQIALDAGFAHQAHFATAFKKMTGFTPGQYRQLKTVH